MDTDPDCLENLADRENEAVVKKKLKDEMFRELRKQGDPRMEGRGEVFDRYPTAREDLRSFYNRYLSGEPVAASWVNDTDFESIHTGEET